MPQATKSIWEKIQTYGTVTAVAILIWLYAEAETIDTYENESIRVHFVAPEGELLIIDPQIQRVEMSIRCTNAQKSHLAELREKGPIQVTMAPISNDQYERDVSLKEELQNSAVGKLGEILRTEPTSIKLHIEAYETVELKIKAVHGNIPLLGFPQVSAATAKIEVPASAVDQIQGVHLEARLDQINVTGIHANEPTQRNLPLTLPKEFGDIDAQIIDPATVEVTFTLRKKTDSIKLPRVQIFFLMSPTIPDRYSIDLSDENLVLTDLELTGPIAAIQRIKDAQQDGNLSQMVYARLDFPSVADLSPGEHSMQPELKLPAGVTAVQPPKSIIYAAQERPARGELPRPALE